MNNSGLEKLGKQLDDVSCDLDHLSRRVERIAHDLGYKNTPRVGKEIVAVNSHVALVEALDGLLEHFNWNGDISEEELRMERKLRPNKARAFEAARAALALAKGNRP